MSLIRIVIYIFAVSVLYSWDANAGGKNLSNPFSSAFLVAALDTFPLKDRKGDFISDRQYNPFDIQPSIITQEVEYDPETGQYIILERIGEEYYRMPTYMTFEEYLEWKSKQQERTYFNRLAGIRTPGQVTFEAEDPMAKIDIEDNLVDRLFGGTEVTIQPRGNIDLTFGVDYQRIQNPFIPPRLQSQGGFDFDMDIQMNVEGKIGEKMNLNFNYNTAATFDFDNKIKIGYDSEAFSEDDIIKKIEAGDVNLPLRSQLIQGNQNLFGVKTEMQFGKLRVTGVASQQRSEQKDLVIENGAVIQEFEIRPDQYDENRHFFISHYNRGKYEGALVNMPQVRSLFRITNIEVWVTNDQNSDLRNSTTVAAISYLGEPLIENYSDPNTLYPPRDPLPPDLQDVDGEALADNSVSDLFQELVNDDVTRNIINTSTRLKTVYGLEQVRDFEVQSMRRLNPNEFTYHPELGFISINIRLRPNQVLGVAYEYTYSLNGGKVYKVGEITDEATSGGIDQNGDPQPDDVIYVKMLKSSNQRIDLPSWDLMMKNVYAIGAGQLNREDFQLDIFFEDNSDATLKRFLPEEGFRTIPLLDVFQLDRLNSVGDPQQDGIFDFVPGLTVNTRTGSVYFPVLEPFGTSLLGLLDNNQELYDKYGYPELYTSSITLARENLDKNRFLVKGKYKSSVSSEINLNAFNIPPGSVVVRAGSQILIEGVDYDIDYGIGRIKILNDAYLQQGVPIRVSYEDQSLFSLQQKTMFGLRFDYEASKKLNIGATYLRLFERPFTEKVNIGDDPINNRIFGLDLNYSTESNFLTKLVDKIPFIDTKEPSFVNFSAEVAALKPGHSGAINISEDEGGVVSIDDFEGAGSTIPLGSRPNLWQLSSTPSRFPESELANDLSYGYNRAKLNWYVIDDRTVRESGDRVDPYTRVFNQQDLFDREIPLSQIPDLLTFDLSYYPNERGPYNFDPPNGSVYSSGLTFDQTDQCVELENPESRWAGITRYLPNNDFEASNFEYIEFWMLNPFMDRRDGSSHPMNEEGYIYFNLGNVSEDILKDNLQFYENSIPTPEETIPVEETVWGSIPLSIPQVQGFDQQNIDLQDLGYDGLGDSGEMELYQDYVDAIRNTFPGDTCVLNDPSNDNFISYLNENEFGDETNLLNKYKYYNNPQGNAPNENSRIGTGNPIPDVEDLNDNRSLEQSESYYEYGIRIRNSNGEIERTPFDNITDEITVTNPGTGNEEKWYRFQIPIRDEEAAVNGIEGFRSIQFIRMYMTGFETQKTFRLAEFELVRNQWRRLPIMCEGIPPDSELEFVVDQVGIEENSNKQPFNYVSPRGIKQERLFNTFSNVLQDEKALKLNVCGLGDSCEARIYKLTQMDLRFFKKLQLFIHAEEVNEELQDGDLSAFIRIGKDFNNNYYEYEVPLVFSDKDSADAVLGDRELYSEQVWREENKMDFLLTEFTELKKIRNREGFPVDQELSSSELPESVFDPEKDGAIVSIKGNPSLGYVKGITIGIRNRTEDNNVCAEVWVNELRMAGLDEEGGVAGVARLELQLADFGDLTMSGSYSSIGWGALDQRVFDRNQERLFDYDIATNLNLGMFFPDNWNLRIPFYAQYAKSVRQHKYDPYELDLTVDEVLELADNPLEEQDIKDRSRETTTIKTFNFTNVRKDRSGSGSPKPWDPSNFSVSYSYTQTEYKDELIERDLAKDYRGGLDYNYSRSATYIEPFKSLKSDALRIFRDFNFNPLPNAFSFSTQMRRFSSEKLYRLPDDIDFVFNDQRFDWDRRYSMQWDLSKGLNMSFNANNYAVIDQLRQTGIRRNAEDRPWVDETGNEEDEVTGRSYSSLVQDDPGYTKEYTWDNIKDFGRTKNYDHNLSVNYNVPINLLPLMDWITVKATYNASYTWSAASLNVQSLGNVIQNRQNRSLNSTFDFQELYNKSSYLQKIEGRGTTSRTNRSRSRRRTGRQTPDTQSGQQEESEGGERDPSTFEKILIRPLLAIRNLKFTYREDLSTVVPGFLPSPDYIGLSDGFTSPGFGFVFGRQPNFDPENPNNWLFNAADNNWISTDRFQNQQVLQNNRQDYEAKLELEPFSDFRIDVTMKKTYSENHSEDFINTSTDPDNPAFEQLALRNIGSFDITYFALGTLFDDDINGLFQKFESERATISKRLPNNTNESHDKDGALYAKGYGKLHSAVVIHSFLAAYTGEDAQAATLDIQEDIRSRGYIPKPNWNVSYNGLSKLPMFKSIFSSFSINHAYRSNLRVNSFETDLQYDRTDPYFIDPNISQANYFSRLRIPSVVIQEQFVPIIGISCKTVNDLNLNFEYRKTRNLSLLTGNISQLTEARTTDFTFGLGWTLSGVNIGFLTGDSGGAGRRRTDPETTPPDQSSTQISNSRGRQMTINLDVSFRDDVTWIHEIDKGASAEPIRGLKTLRINPSIDYDVNSNLTLRMFVDYSKTKPYLSTSYPITSVQGGLTARFNLN